MQVVLPDGQQVGPATATGTITDDDALSVGVSADALAVVEGEAATFTLALSGATATAPVLVDYTVTGAARAGSDYTAPGGSLTLPPGAATGRLTIQTLADEEPEAEESIFVTLERAHTATRTVAVDPTAVRTRIADRGTATISVAPAVSVTAAAVEEGNPVQFVATLSRAIAADVTVEWKTEAVLGASAAATAGRDYRGVAAATIDLGAGSTAATLEVQTLDDALHEADETFALTLTGVSRSAGVALGAATAIGTIGDNDAAPSLTISDRDAREDAGTMVFPVTLDAESGRRGNGGLQYAGAGCDREPGLHSHPRHAHLPPRRPRADHLRADSPGRPGRARAGDLRGGLARRRERGARQAHCHRDNQRRRFP